MSERSLARLTGTVLLLSGLAAITQLAGCGQRGPLYLPEHNGRVVTRPAGAAPASSPRAAPGTTSSAASSAPSPAP